MKSKPKKSEKYRALIVVIVTLCVLFIAFFWFSKTPDCGPPVKNVQEMQRGEPLPAPCYEGLTSAGAKAKAESARLDYRVVEEDGKPMLITADYSTKRVNVTLSEGTVVKAAFY
jgi:hypothetical protein